MYTYLFTRKGWFLWRYMAWVCLSWLMVSMMPHTHTRTQPLIFGSVYAVVCVCICLRGDCVQFEGWCECGRLDLWLRVRSPLARGWAESRWSCAEMWTSIEHPFWKTTKNEPALGLNSGNTCARAWHVDKRVMWNGEGVCVLCVYTSMLSFQTCFGRIYRIPLWMPIRVLIKV